MPLTRAMQISLLLLTTTTSSMYTAVVVLEVVRTRVSRDPLSPLALSQLTFSEITAKFSQKRMKM